MQLSILVCAYNAQATIQRCLESLLKQSLTDYEIVVVNDGSKDDTAKIVKEMAKQYSQIRLINQENQGVGAARNHALKAAYGEYVTYVDSDDWVEANCYDEIMEMTKKGYDIVCYDAYKFNQGIKMTFDLVKANEGEITPQTYFTSVPCPWNKVMRKSLFTEHELSFPEHIIYEDYATIPNLAKTTDKIYYLKRYFINYDISNDSITRGNQYKEKAIDIFKASTYLYENCDLTRFSNELQAVFYEHILVSSCRYFIAFHKLDFANLGGAFVKQRFPKILKCPLLKLSFKEKLIANSFLNQHAGFVRWLVMRKKGVNHEN